MYKIQQHQGLKYIILDTINDIIVYITLPYGSILACRELPKDTVTSEVICRTEVIQILKTYVNKHNMDVYPIFINPHDFGQVPSINSYLDRLLQEECEHRWLTKVVRKIQRAYLPCYYDPKHDICRNRLMRQANELVI